MYGMVNKALEEMVVLAHGEATWELIKDKAKVDVEVFVANEGYDDAITYQLVGATSEVLGLPAAEVLHAFGVHWVLHTAREGYGQMMEASGRTLREFLLNLTNFHARVELIFPHLRPPVFRCSDVEGRSLRLHYLSEREGLAPFVVGLLDGLGQSFATEVEVIHTVDKAGGAGHDEFIVRW